MQAVSTLAESVQTEIDEVKQKIIPDLTQEYQKKFEDYVEVIHEEFNNKRTEDLTGDWASLKQIHDIQKEIELIKQTDELRYKVMIEEQEQTRIKTEEKMTKKLKKYSEQIKSMCDNTTLRLTQMSEDFQINMKE